MKPHVEQHKGQGNQDKAIGRIFGGGPAPHPPCAAIAGLNAKATPVQLASIAGREGQMDLNEQQPGGLPLVPPGSPGGGEGPTDEDRSGELL